MITSPDARVLGILLPGKPIPWNDAHLAQPFKQNDKRWSARFVTAPRARDMKSNVRDLVRAQLVSTGKFDQYWRSRKQLFVGIIYHGRFWYVNPFVHRDTTDHSKYRASWYFYYVHEILLHAHLSDLANRPGTPPPEVQVIPISQIISMAKARWNKIDIEKYEVAETIARYSSNKRALPFKSIFSREGNEVHIRALDLQRMIKDPANYLERRDIDLDALNKLIQDAIFETLYPKNERTDAIIDGYHFIYRHLTLLPHQDRVIYTLYDR